MAKWEGRIWIGRDAITGIVYAVTAAATRQSCKTRIEQDGIFSNSVKPVRFKLIEANPGDVFTQSRKYRRSKHA